MANPRLEDGFTMIPNELIEAFARTRFSSSESRVFWLIVRKTWGWTENGKQKRSDWISLSQFSLGTDLLKPNVCRAIGRLVDRNIIRRDENKRVSIQQDYALWKRNVGKKDNTIVNIDNTFIRNDTHKRNLIQEKPLPAYTDG